ncbi:MAG: sulfotransferase [Anaerolineales bacterium]
MASSSNHKAAGSSTEVFLVSGEMVLTRAFIVGCPRSGTTLVQKLLGARQDTYTLRETHFFQNIRRPGPAKLLDYWRLSKTQVDLAYAFISRNNDLQVEHDPRNVRSLPQAVHFLDQLMSAEASARGRVAWVEKTPAHLYFVRWIERYLPSAHIVHVLRDGRDVVASLIDVADRFPQAKAWRYSQDVSAAIGTYNRYLRASLKCRGRSNHVFIRYEHIIEDVDREKKRLFNLLDLADQESSATLKDLHHSVVREDEVWKEDFGNQIRDTRLAKFNRLFDDEQKQWIISRLVEIP